MILNKKEIDAIDMTFLKEWCTSIDKPNVDKEAGLEHYRLLTYIAMQYDNIYIGDVGMRDGASAYALASNPNNIVKTFEINKAYKPNFDLENIEIHYHDCVKDLEPLMNCYVVMIDMDPHDGKQEKIIMEKLIDYGYEGIIILDDIGSCWPHLKEFWDNITVEKYDITEYGHFSGTGLINFTEEEIVLA